MRVLEPGDHWYPAKLSEIQINEASRLGVPVAIEDHGIPLVLIPGGEIWMGAGDDEKDDVDPGSYGYSRERPRHLVRLKAFYIGITPVTQEQWERVTGTNPSTFKGADRPVEPKSWKSVQGFLKKVSPLQLPSEAQWECAARGGTTFRYWWGDPYQKGMANCGERRFAGEKSNETTEVGRYPANPYGLFDILGNVEEWCSDGYHDNYIGAPSNGRPWKYIWNYLLPEGFIGWLGWFGGSHRVSRGGSWQDDPRYLRVSYRSLMLWDGIYTEEGLNNRTYLGFRCARRL